MHCDTGLNSFDHLLSFQFFYKTALALQELIKLSKSK